MTQQWHGGKGSGRRKPLVSQEQVDKNWETIQRNNKKLREEAEKTKENANGN
jgi:hypothetical protein